LLYGIIGFCKIWKGTRKQVKMGASNRNSHPGNELENKLKWINIAFHMK